MDPATSELAQVITLATSIVGAVVYLQRAQMASLTKLAELLKPQEGALTVKLDADQSGRFAEVLKQTIDVRGDVRELDSKVDSLGQTVAGLAATVRATRKRTPSTRIPVVREIKGEEDHR